MDRKLTQYATTDALAARQGLYDFAVGPTRADHVREALDGFDGMSILDGGCGNGKLLAETQRTNTSRPGSICPSRSVRVTLLDTSEAIVE
jgi:2-polyprenyl-3-methyl-5-hydroxy-6-metoxy-1,4-benzoquinol methylase